MAALGHAILGDLLYASTPGQPVPPPPPQRVGGSPHERRLHLHAESLSLTHPASGKRLNFVASAPFITVVPPPPPSPEQLKARWVPLPTSPALEVQDDVLPVPS
jgi:hypothetical protein